MSSAPGPVASREFDRFVHVGAHEVVEVVLVQLDLLEAGRFRIPRGGFGVAE